MQLLLMLLKKMRASKFIGTIYVLSEILPTLSTLSKSLQNGKLNFSAVKPAVSLTVDQFIAIKEESSALLQKNLISPI